jgi:hypothetical protein
MPVALGYCVVDRMLSGDPRNREASTGSEVHANRQRPGLCIEIGAGHKPRAANPQRRFEQFLGHPHQPELRTES